VFGDPSEDFRVWVVFDRDKQDWQSFLKLGNATELTTCIGTDAQVAC
jgi:hypothetical protein